MSLSPQIGSKRKNAFNNRQTGIKYQYFAIKISLYKDIFIYICRLIVVFDCHLSGVITMRKTFNSLIFEPCHEKTCLRGFRPGLTETRLYSQRRWLGLKFGIKEVDVYVLHYLCSENKGSASFVFAYARSRFSHDKAH